MACSIRAPVHSRVFIPESCDLWLLQLIVAHNARQMARHSRNNSRGHGAGTTWKLGLPICGVTSCQTRSSPLYGCAS